MSVTVYPDKYLQMNAQTTKNLSLVMQIDGAPDMLSLGPIYTRIRYGDSGLTYGEPGLIYGGLRLVPNVQPILDISGGLTLSQRIEPEQGRGSVSTLSLKFIDKDGYMSRLVSPGVLVDEPLGNRAVRIYLGYQGTSFPEDYITIFRGYITQTTVGNGRAILQVSDANAKRKAQAFFSATTTVTSTINPSDTTIHLGDTSGFFQQIIGPNGGYDSSVKTYVLIDSEWIEYPATGISGNTLTGVTRGARGTTADTHAVNTSVATAIQLQGNAIELALKIMLSGWDGPWKTGVSCRSINNPLDALVTTTANSVLIDSSLDAVSDLGLVVGDTLTISGSTAGNNGSYLITSIADAGGLSNRLIYVNGPLNLESPASGVSLAFRSQFDTLPILCGMSLTPNDVDVQTHIDENRIYLSQAASNFQFFIQQPTSAKTFIESECFFPIGVYSVTRYGKLSMVVTKPPIAGQKVLVLDNSNILDPQDIMVTRGTNTRRFFNEIQYQYDLDDGGTYRTILDLLDTTSITKIATVSQLPIPSSGLKSALGGTTAAVTRGRFLLNRFKNAAFEVPCKVNWGAGSQIEIGDTVMVKDNGTLKITNFNTGERDIGTQFFEVLQRELSVKDGTAKLTLLSSIGAGVSDRYATIAPSSMVTTGSTATSIRIQDSFGALYPGAEYKKWQRVIGEQIVVHSYDWAHFETRTLVGFDAADNYRMIIDPPLIEIPTAGYIVDVAAYDSTTSVNPISKLMYSFLDFTATVVTGISATQFTLSLYEAGKLVVGLPILIHNADYSIESPEVVVLSVVGSTVTVKSSLGFTPAAGQKVELIPQADKGGPYRYV